MSSRAAAPAKTRLLGAAEAIPRVMRLLLVEDDVRIAAFITKSLRQSGFVSDHCADGAAGCARALEVPYDLAIIDGALPSLDGVDLVATLRARKMTLPILMLSVRDNVEDRVRGLQAGADDYLAKPFALDELLARVDALIRRATTPALCDALEVAGLRLDLRTRSAEREGQTIELQRREYALLEYLLRSEGRVVTKMMILNHVWDYAFDPQTNVVDVLVYRLRQKIDKNFEQKLIRTVRGSGYALRAG